MRVYERYIGLNGQERVGLVDKMGRVYHHDVRPSWDEYFLQLAHFVSKRATCPRLHVGSVIVDQKHNILSTGYNGSKPGESHCEDVGCLIVNGHCTRTIHSEKNAINRLYGGRYSLGATLYTTHQPCKDCEKLIRRAKIKRVVYEHTYTSPV